ncbi:MAG: hypothetical protein ACP5OU_00240 [Methanothrix sp.]
MTDSICPHGQVLQPAPGLEGLDHHQDRICLPLAASGSPGRMRRQLQLLSAAGFLLYGPIENSEIIFAAAALADILVAEAVRDLEIVPGDGHPLNRLV